MDIVLFIVNREFSGKLTYFLHFLFQAFHMDRDDIALGNFSEYFKKASEEERGHAELLMKFQNQRGGRIVLKDIKVGVTPSDCRFMYHQ